jgi:hypothetical protein
MANVKILEQDGSAFLIEIYRDMPNLSLKNVLLEIPLTGMQSEATRNTEISKVICTAALGRATVEVCFPSLSLRWKSRMMKSVSLTVI